jgi:hypothetical protein
MSLQDYATRRYDLLAFEGVHPEKESRLNLLLFSEKNSGQICTGIQKLAQRWLLEFLTERGSMLGKPTRGCDFMRLVRTGRLHNQTDVFYAFSDAETVVQQNLRQEETDTMEDDERIESAAPISISFLPGYAQLRVEITSLAGNTKEIILPVSTLP